MAEWSKALVLGTSPPGRGFESHHYQIFYFYFHFQYFYIECVGMKKTEVGPLWLSKVGGPETNLFLTIDTSRPRPIWKIQTGNSRNQFAKPVILLCSRPRPTR